MFIKIIERNIFMKFKTETPLDELLDGGIETGVITNLYGEPGSGKTNLCLGSAIACAKSGKFVIFIDTENSFSPERFEQLSKKSSKEIAKKIIILEPKTWKDQCYQIEQIEKIFNKYNIGLIIVDSIVALWRIEINDENAQEVNRSLAKQLSILSKLASKKSIPVLITNQIYCDIESGKLEPSSRNIVKWWSKNLIELSRSGRNRRLARIERARAISEGRYIEFEIKENGFEIIRKSE